MASIDTAPQDTSPSDTPLSTQQELPPTVNPNEQSKSPPNTNTDKPDNDRENDIIDNTTLFNTLISQLEHIFSKDYLSYDPYLVSQLDNEFYLPIALIEELPAIKALTADSTLVHDALRASQKIVVSEERRMAKPACKLVQRNTIILRDLPESTTEEDIRDLIKNEERFTSAIIEMKLDYGHTCFIKFNSEDIILDAWTFFREQTIKGQPVQARIKSEYLLKSFSYRPPPPVSPFYGTPPYSTNGNTKGRMYPLGGRVTGGRGYNNNNNNNNNNLNNNKGGTWYPRGDGNYQRNTESQKGKGNRYGRRGKNYQGGRNFEGKSGRYNRQKGGRGGGGFFNNNKNDSNRRSPATLNMAPSHWPPLPSSDIAIEQSNFKKDPQVPPSTVNEDQPIQVEEEKTTPENDESLTGSEILNSVPQNTKPPGDTPHTTPSIDPDSSGTPTNGVSTETDKTNTVTVASNGKTPETPTGAPIPGWPAINSSSVKLPPKNTLQEKNRDDKIVTKTFPQQKKQRVTKNDKEPTQNRPPTTTQPTASSGKTRKPGNHGKTKIRPQNTNHHQKPPPPSQKPAVTVPPPKPAGPSYADIARLNSPAHQQQVLPMSAPPSQQPQVPPSQGRPHHVQTQLQQQERSD